MHELCTNALKYGALSVPTGRVAVTWSVDDGRFRWTWCERGGPPVAAPARAGFGSRMIERLLAGQLAGRASLAYRSDGLVCQIDAPLAAVRDGAKRV